MSSRTENNSNSDPRPVYIDNPQADSHKEAINMSLLPESMTKEELAGEECLLVVPNSKMESLRQTIRANFSIRNLYVRLFLAEFFGTFILLIFGDGVVAQTVLTQREHMPKGNINTIHIGWGFAVIMGVFATSTVSAGHINPAFSLACAVLGKLPWAHLPIYFAGQYLGAFFGACVVYLTYYDSIHAFELPCIDVNNTHHFVTGSCATAGIFATYPHPHLSVLGGFMDQMVGTALLAGMALAIVNNKTWAVPLWSHPFMIGIMVATIVAAFEANCGAALNPARDLGPRIFTAIAGWGTKVFSFNDYKWFWIPILGPHTGALVGALFYKVFIDLHVP